MASNFCKLHICLNRCIARNRRRNGKCELSTRLLSHLPVFVFLGTELSEPRPI